MFAPAPSAEKLARLGFTPEDFADEAVAVWPDNERAYGLFSWARTQWIVGFGGATGLNYIPLQHKMDRMRLEPDEYDELEAEIQVMEFAALAAMNEKD